jgi:hypothetical protein
MCKLECKTCVNPNECTSCNQDFGRIFVNDGGICTYKCPVKTFTNQLEKKCDICDKSCENCNGKLAN